MLVNKILINFEHQKVDNTKGVVFIIHGIAEHLEYYRDLSRTLNEAGYDTITYDLRGHGQSGGKRGYVKKYSDFVDDLHILIRELTKKEDKIFLVGISLGGLIAQLYRIRYGHLSGVVTVGSPLTGIKVNFIQRIGLRLFGFLKMKTNFLDPKLSNNFDDVIEDPLALPYFHLRMGYQMLIRGAKHLEKNQNKNLTPMLLMHGGDDKIVLPEVSKTFMERSNATDIEMIEYDGVKHMVFKDILKEDAANDLIRWLDKRI